MFFSFGGFDVACMRWGEVEGFWYVCFLRGGYVCLSSLCFMDVMRCDEMGGKAKGGGL